MANIVKQNSVPALTFSEIGLVRCLGSAGIPVFTGSESNSNSALYSRYSKKQLSVSSYESEMFILELIDLGKNLDFRPTILTYDDRLLLNMSRNRERLSPYYQFLLPGHEMVENLLEKQKFIKLSEEHDLPTPASVKVFEESDLQTVIETLKPPYLIKPVYRHHWFNKNFAHYVGTYKKAFTCRSKEELEEKYSQITHINPRVVVQEYIEGPDSRMYDINMYVDTGGEVKGSIVCQKLRAYPPNAGYGSYVVTISDDELLELSKKIVQQLQLVGLVNLQYKKDIHTDTPKLFEIHPRTSIFDVIGIKAGVNLPAIYHADMQGLPIPEMQYKTGVKFINIGRDLRLYLKNGRQNGLSAPSMLKTYIGPTVFEGYSLRDPGPSFMDFWWSVRRILKV